MNELEEQKKRAFEKFFEEAEFEPRELYQLMEKVGEHLATINRKGDVFIKGEALTDKDKVAVVAIARFLANQADNKINPTITAEEVVRYTQLDKNVVSARLSDLVKEGLLLRVERGVYKARSLPRVKEYLSLIHI